MMPAMMEMEKISKLIDKVHEGEMSIEQAFNKIQAVAVSYFADLDRGTEAAILQDADIRREIMYMFDYRNGILAGQAEGDETQVEADIEKLAKTIGLSYETAKEMHEQQTEEL
jgi:hypothetical protein